MQELMKPDTPIILTNLKKEIKETTPQLLLPFAFDANDLINK
jgi:cytidine deaminase